MAKRQTVTGTRSGALAKTSSEKLREKDDIITCFRPHVDVREDYIGIIEWCEQQDPPNGFSSIINSFLPAICYTLRNRTFVDRTSGRTYMRCDFGDILIREPRLPNTK